MGGEGVGRGRGGGKEERGDGRRGVGEEKRQEAVTYAHWTWKRS